MLGSKQDEKVKKENYRDSGQNKEEMKTYEPRERETLNPNSFLVLGLFFIAARVYFLHRGFIIFSYSLIICPLLYNKNMGKIYIIINSKKSGMIILK